MYSFEVAVRFSLYPSCLPLWVVSGWLASATVGVACPEPPIELGRVHWGRDVDAGFAAALRTGRPLLLLFQEIPGCATCKSFGQGPLSTPLLVDAMESEFIPVVVYNNCPGADAEALRRFHEASWNNPVMRFFTPSGKELVPRRDGIWDTPAIAERLLAALRAAQRPTPRYLELAALESRSVEASQAIIGMHCFWQGEASLGTLDGVIETRALYVQGSEAVEVTYLPERLSTGELLGLARKRGAARAFAPDTLQLDAARLSFGERALPMRAPPQLAMEADQKWHLKRSALRWLPLSPAQQARVNGDLAFGGDGLSWLSPRQADLARRIDQARRQHPEVLETLEPAPELGSAGAADYEALLLERLHEAAIP